MKNQLKNREALNEIISNITNVNEEMKKKAKERLDSLAKPLGSLGKLEDICIQLAGITGKAKNTISKKAVIIMSADNGVVEEGIGSAPQYVTLAQTINFTKGLTGVAVIAKQNNTDLIVVDVGINSDIKIEKVINCKISKSTKNIAKGPAMTYEQCIQAINVGIKQVEKAKKEGYSIIGVGEMGIGNTTTSSTVLISLTKADIEEVVGKGGGITKEAFDKKKLVVKKALEINKPNNDDVIDILSKVGGYDIAAMTGVFLGCAYYKIPVVVDGIISAVSALCAVKINPIVKEYLILSHLSMERGYKIAIDEIGLKPMLDLNMRLGEGSGCPIAFSIIESACAVINNMATFEEARIDNEYIDKIRSEECYVV